MVTFALHSGAAFLLLGLVLWQPLTAGPVGFVFGWLREQSYEWGQTRQLIKIVNEEREKDDIEPLSGKPSFLAAWWDWQTPHKLWEAAQWGIGGLLVGALFHFLGA